MLISPQVIAVSVATNVSVAIAKIKSTNRLSHTAPIVIILLTIRKHVRAASTATLPVTKLAFVQKSLKSLPGWTKQLSVVSLVVQSLEV